MPGSPPLTVILFDPDLRETLIGGAPLARPESSPGSPAADVSPEIFPPETRRVLEPHYRNALRGINDSFEISLSARRYIGETSPARDGAGAVRGGIFLLHEIPESSRPFEAADTHRRGPRDVTARLAEAEETERRKLARELHDRVGQNLTALGLSLNILRKQLPPWSDQSLDLRVKDCLRLLEETGRHIRDVTTELRPPVLDDYGLAAALRWYGDLFAQRTGVAVIVPEDELSSRLPLPVEIAFFRIAQEALTNVARHARATQVVILVEEFPHHQCCLTITDDGVGFDVSPGGSPRTGWGLIMMRERAEAIGAEFRLESAPGKGTRIRVAKKP